MLFLVFIIFCWAIAKAQNEVPSIQTPAVADINKFIDFPVNKGTGVPEIGIPLYTIKEPDFSLPVSITYHAGGIKVEEQSSDIGLGWTMNLAGSISRVVRDKPDEQAAGYYVNYGSLVKNWHQCSVFNTDPSQPYNPNEYDVLTFDKEPDMFYFSVGDFSGRFLFDQNRTIHIIPEQDIIIKNNNDQLTSWTITLPNGAQYIFGAYEHTSGHGLVSTQDDVISSWKVTQIITPNQHTINFQYQPSGYQDETIEPYQQPVGTYADYNSSLRGRVYYTNYSGLQITKITSDLCEMDFNYSTTRRADVKDGYNVYALSNVQIKSVLSGAVQEQYNLYQSYFTSTMYPTIDYGWPILGYQGLRLRLDSIAELDANGNRLPAYIFSYNKNNPVTNLPYRVSTGRDHWGYYNGVTTNQVLVADPGNASNWLLSPWLSVLANREPNSAFRAAYILDEIIFPTGGVTDYIFESCGDPASNNIFGGLRVRQITNDPGNGQLPIVKQYTYENPILTGGPPVYTQISQDVIAGCTGPDYNTSLPCSNYTNMVYNDPINTSGGDISSNFVVHGKVTESQPGNGSHEYYFDVDHILDESNYDEIGTCPYILKYPLLYSGKLLSEIVKDANGNPLTETDYTYAAYNRTAVPNTQEWRTFYELCDPYLMPYDQLTGSIYLSQKNEIVYDPVTGGSTTKVTNYTFGGIPSVLDIVNNNAPTLHQFPTAITTTLSDGTQDVIRYKYPLDYQAAIGTPGGSATWDGPSNGIQTLISQHKIGTRVEELDDRVRNGTESVIRGKLNLFSVTAGGSGHPQVSLSQVSTLNTLNPIPYSNNFFSTITQNGSSYQFNNNSSYQASLNLTRYDAQNDVLDYTARDGIHKSYLWGYKSNYPIAQIINASAANCFYTSFEEASGTGIVSGGKTGLQSSTAGLQTTLTGLTNGNYLLTWWSYSGGAWTLQSSKASVTNGTYSINLTGQVDEVRFCPANAFMVTYTYSPLAGITSINDPNNWISYFEYDSFGRLLRTRDQDYDIIKQYNYQYQYNPYSKANWQPTGATRCKPCEANTNYVTSTGQVQMQDVNSSSPTYNQTTWVDQGTSNSCVMQMANQDWQNTSAPPVCATDAYGMNTGAYLQQQVDENPCSSTYTSTQQTYITSPANACPLPKIYVKIGYNNVETFDDGSVYADVYAYFYSDAACTQPYNAGNIDGFSVTYERVDPCGSGATTTTVDCWGGSSQQLDYSDYQSYPQNGQTCIVTYKILPDPRYVVVN